MSRPIVLVVDDEPLITSMLEMIFDLGLDADVVTTNSSLRAREILQQTQISLLVTDYLMPDLNGLSLIRAIRDQGNHHRSKTWSSTRPIFHESDRSYTLGFGYAEFGMGSGDGKQLPNHSTDQCPSA